MPRDSFSAHLLPSYFSRSLSRGTIKALLYCTYVLPLALTVHFYPWSAQMHLTHSHKMPVRCNSSEIKCAPRWSASLYICVPVCTFFCKYLGPVCQENYPQVGTVCWVEKSRDYLHECVNTEGFKIFTQHVIIPFLYTTRSHEVHMVNTKERGLWTSAKTHSLCKSIIQYVHSEITDDQKVGAKRRQLHTFHVRRGPCQKRLGGPPITSGNDNTGDKWRQ